jgi:hypothetical protein
MKKELLTIGDGLLNSFISRNNDVNGYWGIGKLLNLFIENGNVSIDLKERNITPNNSEFKEMIGAYSDRLTNMMKNRNISSSTIISAIITITVSLNDDSKHYSFEKPHKVNCELTIIDLVGKTYSISKSVWCREHDKKRELKSGRV